LAGEHLDPKVMLRNPAIEGSRITVEYIWDELSGGQSFEALGAHHLHACASSTPALDAVRSTD
jgi:hypothetical protein